MTNKHLIHALIDEAKRREPSLSRAEIARRCGTSPQNFARALSGGVSLKIFSRWIESWNAGPQPLKLDIVPPQLVVKESS